MAIGNCKLEKEWNIMKRFFVFKSRIDPIMLFFATYNLFVLRIKNDLA